MFVFQNALQFMIHLVQLEKGDYFRHVVIPMGGVHLKQ